MPRIFIRGTSLFKKYIFKENPIRGFSLLYAFQGIQFTLSRVFERIWGNFAVCGQRQGLFALDLSRFFIKKLRKKF